MRALEYSQNEPSEESLHLASLLARRLPGVRLDSVVQGWVYLEEYDRGIGAYSKLESPSAEDDRWLGVCHFKLFDDLKALKLFVRAAQRGVAGAKVNQAHLLRFLERSDESTRILEEIDPSNLSRYDQVLYYRVRSIHEETGGNIRSALKHAEEAWMLVQGIPEFVVLAPSVLAQLGVLYARYGRAQRALWHLERGIQITSGFEQLKVRLKRAVVLTTLGRYVEARAELDLQSSADDSKILEPERNSLQGDVAWALGDLERAVSLYSLVADGADLADFAYEVFLSETAIMTISAYLGRASIAREHRTRAEGRISDKSDELHFRFRCALVDRWMGAIGNELALEALSTIASELFEMGLLQEMGSVKLHMAAIETECGPSGPFELLQQLHVLSVTLQNSAFLAKEWSLLPGLRRIASESHPSLVSMPTAIAELHTLGEERIVLAGRDVRLPLRRSVELLAYFIENRSAAFEQVRQDLFPDEKPRTAKSYFHQFRHQLRQHVDGLQIEYERESRTYRLKADIDILWDVADTRAGRRRDRVGTFLPSSTSDWALTIDHALERYRSHA